MEEKRQFGRWNADRQKNALVSCGGVKEEASILDISAGGMRISFPKPLDVGSTVYGEFNLMGNLGPFFVRGKVDRVKELKGIWEVAVAFEKVSTIPIDNS